MGEKKTNVVMILSDDQGSWAMGCYGNPEIKTPNLDRLAERGTRFENFYCVSPVCSPARASLLTGKIPSQHGIHDYLSGGNGGAEQESIEFLKEHRGYTDVLAENGYTCGLSGKWHLGAGMLPQKGFSFWYTHQKGGGPYYNAPMIRNGKLVQEPGYITDVITDEAIHFLDEQKGSEKPFYLSVHYTAPHSPWMNCHPEEYTRVYKDCKFESCPQEEIHPWAKVNDVDGYRYPRECLTGYFAAVTAMDANIGRIMDKLEADNLLDDTLIIFTSDNGFNCGHHGVWGKGNGTFPVNMYDSSVKVPFIASQPGKIPEGAVCKAMCSGYDFMPTLLEYLGLECPDDPTLPGKSFCRQMMGNSTEEDAQVVVCDEYGPCRMICDGKYKLVWRYPFGPNECYDLVNDPKETKNLIDDPDSQEIIQKMKQNLEAWFYKYVDPRVDGTHEAVAGRGQKHLAGVNGPGIHVYG